MGRETGPGSRLLLLLLLLLGPWGAATDNNAACGSSWLRRVVGGRGAAAGQWPWQGSVAFGGRHVCGGALIAPGWLLSAAHCFPPENPLSEYRVTLGTLQLLSPPAEAQVRRVVSVTLPPSSGGRGGDLALLRLHPPVTPGRLVSPVCLPAPRLRMPPGTNCTLTGWGDVRSSGPLPPPKTLQQLQVPLLSRRRCRCLYRARGAPGGDGDHLSPATDTLCAGYPQGQKDACQGDSGGPLSCRVGSGPWLLAGVVSWGESCGLPARPGVYTDVAAHSAWIAAQIRAHRDPHPARTHPRRGTDGRMDPGDPIDGRMEPGDPSGTDVRMDPGDPSGTDVRMEPGDPSGTDVRMDPGDPSGTDVRMDPGDPSGTDVRMEPGDPSGTDVRMDPGDPSGTDVRMEPGDPSGTDVRMDPGDPSGTDVRMDPGAAPRNRSERHPGDPNPEWIALNDHPSDPNPEWIAPSKWHPSDPSDADPSWITLRSHHPSDPSDPSDPGPSWIILSPALPSDPSDPDPTWIAPSNWSHSARLWDEEEEEEEEEEEDPCEDSDPPPAPAWPRPLPPSPNNHAHPLPLLLLSPWHLLLPLGHLLLSPPL